MTLREEFHSELWSRWTWRRWLGISGPVVSERGSETLCCMDVQKHGSHNRAGSTQRLYHLLTTPTTWSHVTHKPTGNCRSKPEMLCLLFIPSLTFGVISAPHSLAAHFHSWSLNMWERRKKIKTNTNRAGAELCSWQQKCKRFSHLD